MYNALNEDFLLQEVRDHAALLRASYAAGTRPAGDRRWWRRGARRTR